jgi:hypothetical protein
LQCALPAPLVAIAIVGGSLVLLFFLRSVRFFAFLVLVFLLYVYFYLALVFLLLRLDFRLLLVVGAMESASDSLSGSTETSEWMIFLGIGRG